MLNRIEEKTLEKLIKKMPDQAAVFLSKEMGLAEEVRQELLNRLLEYPLSTEGIDKTISNFYAYNNVAQEERDRLTEFVLSKPLSQKQADSYLDAAERMIEGKNKAVTEQYRSRLLQLLTEQGLPDASVPSMSKALISSDGMKKEQREEMLDYLLGKNLSAKQLELCVAAVSQRGDAISAEQQAQLLTALTSKRVAARSVPVLTGALISSDSMYKEQREDMLEYLLSRDLSEKQIDQCAAAVAGRANMTSPEQRTELLTSLAAKGIPAESVPTLINALICTDGMSKTQRGQMLKYLLGQELSDGQVSQCAAAVVAQVSAVSLEQRTALFTSLVAGRIPVESVPVLTSALIASNAMYKEQREEMLEYLLGKQLSAAQVARCAAAAAEQAGMIENAQRAQLLCALAAGRIPAESAPALTGALISSNTMYKEQREEMLEYLLSMQLSRAQLDAYLKKLPEAASSVIGTGVSEMAGRILAFQEAWKNLGRWVDQDRVTWNQGKRTALERVMFENMPVDEALLDLICEGNLCYLKGACMEFIDRKQLWLMMEELLFAEEYCCDFDNERPVILDCGTNIGLAIYYYKHRYPNAKVIGFEPWSVAHGCAVRNVQRNGWEDVVVHNVALDARAGVMDFFTMEENSLAGSLTNRMDEVFARTNRQQVQVCCLSEYLDGPVDFLKMDIEGVEGRVLNEVGEKLSAVKWLFVEYHYGPTLEGNSLAGILSCLEKNGFVYEVSKSRPYSRLTARPFGHVGQIVSELIWAKRR